MNSILPVEPAKTLCLDLIGELDSGEYREILDKPGNGRMFGVLVCQDGTVYRSFSGLLNGEMEAPGFVPPCFDVNQVKSLLSHYDLLVKSSDTYTASSLSRECFKKLRDLYRFCCFDGKWRTLSSIIPVSPAGTGDCCAPRLLSYCYSQGKKPLSMAEFYYGNGSFPHLSFHTPCDERCKNLLKYIIGLDIIYQDSDIVVVNKAHGLLSIEGRTADKQDCVASRIRNLFPSSIKQPCIHRLDQATSGIIVLGLTEKAHNILSKDFENHNVYKEYEAVVEGKITTPYGVIDAPMRLDTENRPHQIIDYENGKNAVTEYTVLGIRKVHGGYVTKLRLVPKTGRTHQLRVHCSKIMGHPILNDPLYGNAPSDSDENPLMLQARVLEFTHPVTKERMHFESDSEF